ncbi:MAG: ABC transporter ATP-binding protein [Chitinispirillaceae bacterium]|nr:ABC transporter ATP-binding protein [Chitinispirillaceae bacterium]
MVTVRVEGLEFGYNAHPVISGMSLDINRGDVVAVVGRNGAGKSTLLKCINHLLTPIKGTVFINEENVAAMSLRQRARRFGYLSQRSEQLFPVTVFDVVLAGRYPHSPVRFTRRDEEITAEVLTMLELDEFAHRQFNRLSGGEQQQVLIARALVQGAEVLLFDEPTNNLDLRHQLQIMRLIRSVACDKTITSILAIHDMNLASSFADTIIMLHKGAIFAAGTPSEVFTATTIGEVFGVEVKIYDHHGLPHIVVVDG